MSGVPALPVPADLGTGGNFAFGFGIARVFRPLLLWLLIALSDSCFGSDYALPQRVEVLPVFLVPSDQSPPNQSQKDLFMQHVVIAQARYLAMLGERTTFALATNQPDVVIGRQTLATYRLAADGGAATYVSELLNHYGYTRFNCPYVFAILLVNPTDGYPGGGGRTLNHGWNSGGGMMMMSSWALTNTTNFQSTFQHELGHSFGLLHVDAYGYSMTTNNSIMSYNTAHLSNGLTPSPTPGVLIPEDVRALLRNRRVFPYLQFDPVLDTPAGYSMAANYSWLGPMTIPGHVDYPIQATTPFTGLSPVTAMLHNEIKPSAGPGITFDGANMWHSGFSTNGWAYADINFPLPVSLNKVTIHSQHSGTTYLAERVRIETIVGATTSQVCSNSLQQADQTVTFVPATAQTWRFWFFNSAGYVVIRGLEFFSDSDEIFPPVFPTFNNPPTILAHPTAQTTQQGADVTFTAQAVGSLPLAYQWQRSGTNLINGGRVSGATNFTLSLNGVVSADGGSYSVLVTNAAGVSVSGSALLTVSGGTTALNITAQPTNQTVLVGTNVSFSVSAAGMGPRSYQWRYNGLNLVNGSRISGATSPTLTLTGVSISDSGAYSVTIANGVETITSATATLAAIDPPLITNQPTNQTILAGGTAVLAVGTSGASPMSYQWSRNGSPLSAATNALLLVTYVQSADAGVYTVVVSNAYGTVTSSGAVLSVSAPLVPPGAVPAPAGLISWWAGDGTASDRVGTNHGALLAGASYATGYVGQSFAFDGMDDFVSAPDNLAWAFGTNQFSIELWANFSALSGHRAMVANDEGGGLQNKWIFWRHSTGVLQLQVNYPGGGMSIGSYAFTPVLGAWYHLAITRADNLFTLYVNGVAVQAVTNVVNIPNANAALTIGQAENAFYFGGLLDDVRIYNRALVASEIQAIHTAGTNGMAPPARPSIISQPQSQSVAVSNTVTFSVQAAGSTPLRYQWQLDGNNLLGATNSSLAFASAQLSDIGNYSVIVSNALGVVTSSNALLTVLAAPQIGAQPQSQTVSAGSSATFSVFATGTAPLSYQWRFNGSPLVGATNSTLSLANVAWANGGSYTVFLSNSVGVATSAAATLTVLSPPIVTAGPQSQTVLSGTTVSLSVTVVGTAPLAYQWRKDGVNIGGATGTSHTMSNIQTNQSGTYSVVVSNAYGTVTNAALITVTPGPLAPAIVTQPQSQTVRAGTNVTFTVLATGYPAPDYQWVRNGAALPGFPGPSLTLTNVGLADAGSYYVQIFNASGVTNSAVVTLTVHTLPAFTAQPQPAAFAPGNTAVFTAAAEGVPVPGLNWFKDGVRLTNSAGVSGATAGTLLVFVTGTNQAGSYYAVATNAAGASTSSVVALTVLLPPTITTHPTNVVLLRTNPASVLPALFSVSAAGTPPLGYQWRLNGTSLLNQTNPTLTLPNVTRADGGSYSVLVTNQVGSATSSNALLRVRVPQRLLVPERMADGRLRLVFRDDLGGMPGSNDMSYVEVQFATNLLATNVVWSRLTNALTVTNGMLLLDEPPGMTGSRRFYRVIER